MSEALEFAIEVVKDDFRLEAAAEIPLQGITALSGPSGSGKTTLLRALAGLERAVTGQVRFAGEDWSAVPPARRGVGYVFQDSQLFPHLSVLDNLKYGAIRRGATEGLLEAVIDALDLPSLLDRAPATLSGGETRRVALGRALASAPRVLFMDEPLSGLDRARKVALMPYIARAVASFGVSAIYVTHSRIEVNYLADRVLYMEHGKLLGWAGAAPRLIGQVVNVAPGQVNLHFGDLSLWVDGHGEIGEVWALPFGQDFVVTSANPGNTNAALTLRARVVQATPGSGTIQVNYSGQHLVLDWDRSDGQVPHDGQEVWIVLPKLLGRPIQIEEGVDSS